jgi:hypothetical protein
MPTPDQEILEVGLKTVVELAGLKDAVKDLTAAKKAGNEAQKELTALGKAAKEGFASVASSVGLVAAGMLSVRSVKNFLGDAISEAEIAEKAQRKLYTSLLSTGEATTENIDLFNAYAKEMQATTRFADDLVTEQLSLVKATGLNTDETKRLVAAAADLSALTGDELPQSVEGLTKSLTGQGRALKILGPEFASLTEAQLKAGAAIDLIEKKFGTAAEGETKTLAGANAQLANSYSDLQENIGFFLVETLKIPQVLGAVSAQLQEITAVRTEVDELKDSILELQKVQEGGFQSSRFGSPREVREELERLNAVLRQTIALQADTDISDIIAKTSGANRKPIEIAIELDRNAMERVIKDLEKVGRTSLEIAKKDRDDRLRLLNEVFGGEKNIQRLALDDRRLYADARLRIEREYNLKAKDEQDKQLELQRKALKEQDRLAKQALETFNRARSDIGRGITEFAQSGDKNALLGTAAGVGGLVGEGKGGAAKLVTGAVQGVGNYIAPGLGDAISPFVSFLMQGKDVVKKFMTEFLMSIPEMVEGLVEGIVQAAATWVEQAPKLIDRIISGIPRILTALMEIIPNLASEFISFMPSIANAFIEALIENVPKMVEAIVKGLGNAPGKAFKGIGKAFGLDSGGMFGGTVPAGYGTDSSERFPVNLGTGELVLDRSLTYRLSRQLARQEQGQTMQMGMQGTSEILAAIRGLSSQPVIIQMNTREVARAVRVELQAGFKLA